MSLIILYIKNKTCTYIRRPNEKKIEAALLNNLDQYVTSYITDIEVSDNRIDANTELINERINEIQSEMKNLTISFRKSRITEKEYDKDYEELEAELKELMSRLEPLKERDLTIYAELLKGDWKRLYEALTKENKRAFWRKYVKELVLDDKGSLVRPIFF